MVPYIYACALETAMCIISACIATYRPLWRAARNSNSWTIPKTISRMFALGVHARKPSPGSRGNASITPMAGPLRFANPSDQELQPITTTRSYPPLPQKRTPPPRPQREEDRTVGIGSIASNIPPQKRGSDVERQLNVTNTDLTITPVAPSEKNAERPLTNSSESRDSFHPLRQQPTKLRIRRSELVARKDSNTLPALYAPLVRKPPPPQLDAPPTRKLPLVPSQVPENYVPRLPIM
jgi:hypothetical protein